MLPPECLTTVDAVVDAFGEAAAVDAASVARTTQAILAASLQCARICDRPSFHRGAQTEHRGARGCVDVIAVARSPIQTVNAVSVNGVDVVDFEVISESAIKLPYGVRGLVKVIFTGGYITPSMATPIVPRNLPHDIEQACILLVVSSMRRRGVDIRETSRGGVDASFSRATDAVPPEVEMLLEPYRMVAL